MAHLLSLPSELLLHILSYLPIKSLLAFSETSRMAYILASSSLQTLSLGIYPNRVSSLISQLSSSSPTASPFSRSARSSLHESAIVTSGETSTSSLFNEANTIAHVIPKASEHRPNTLLSFHTALTSSILSRYSVSMRNLELSVWALTPPIADALASLKNVRCLSLRVEDPFGRGFLRRWIINWGSTTDDEDISPRSSPSFFRAMPEAASGTEWNKFSDAWGRLETLRLMGAGISDWQLCRILERNPGLKELWLKKCPDVGLDLLKYMAEEWDGRLALDALSLIECDAAVEIDEEAMEYIGELTNLKHLSLLGCRGVSNDAVARLNHEFWHIPTIDLPHAAEPGLVPAVIEVDPAYGDDDSLW
ncbi:hypothetical protein IWX50DRAFT_214376 [Phyllosticta citricarpa]|uniref:F-box domain-containing protein n=1 Tax=Phyllosticta citricarpa TaxID=55181 RepID=A0ABR1MQX9_9PEZI